MTNLLAALVVLVIMLLKVVPDTSLAKSLHAVFVAYPARQLLRVRRIHLLILLFSLMFLPVAGKVILIAGSIDILVMYVTHAAIYSDFLLATITVVAAAKMRFFLAAMKWGKLRTFFRGRRTRSSSPRA